MTNDIAFWEHNPPEEDNSEIIYYEDLDQEELILLQYYNYLCIQEDPQNRVIYEEKIQYIKNLLQKDQSI